MSEFITVQLIKSLDFQNDSSNLRHLKDSCFDKSCRLSNINVLRSSARTTFMLPQKGEVKSILNA